MLLFDQRIRLKELLHSSLAKAADVAAGFVDVYSFVAYPVSGYVSMGVAFSTRESLARVIDKISPLTPQPEQMHPYCSTDEYYELNADEWEHIYSESFTEVDDLLDRNYGDFYDAGIENERISQFFEELLIEVLSELKAAGTFSRGGFERDILLGIQFSDASGSQFDAMERASQALNSPYWHERYRANLMAQRQMLGDVK